MVDTTLPGVFLKGIASARPAANAVAKGAVYSATDTGVITQSDGVSTWSTFATISSGLADPMTTRGDIIIRNSSNTTARLGRGSAGTVLSSDGTDVSWQAASGASGLTLLEQHTASSSASLAFTTAISSTYDEYLIELVGLQPATNNVDLYMRMSTNGGSSYDTSSLYATSLWAMTNSSTAVGGTAYNSPASAIALRSNTEIDNNATSSLVGTLRLFEPASTAKYKFVIGEMVFVTGGITMIKTTFAGTYKSTTAVNAFQFLFSSGNIALGTIRVYGIAK